MKRACLWLCLVWSTISSAAPNQLHTTITGISDEPLHNANARAAQVINNNPTIATFDEATHLAKHLQDEISQTLAPYGYFKPKINMKLRRDGQHTLLYGTHLFAQ